jgi:23S rRNA (guanine745-N1)-methyltransferase
VCSGALHHEPGLLRCASRHSFDIAREGYVNLLTSADRERGIEGDTRAMLHARRRFLDAGHFAPLLDALREHVNGARCVVEVGCGEGYYIGGLAHEHGRFIGIDIARDAVRMAAQRYRNATFAVANVRRRLYVESHAADVLLSIFAPRNPAEFARIVLPGGSLVIVVPTPAHMANVRAAHDMLDIEQAKEERIEQQFGADFALVQRRVLEYPLELGADALRDFIMMGPTARHHAADDVDEGAATVASFVVLKLQRRQT